MEAAPGPSGEGRRVRRRALLRAGAAALAASALPASALAGPAPAVHVRRRKRLRVLGTHATLQPEIRARAEKDLDIELEFRPGGSAGVLQQASKDPASFDIYEQWSNSTEILWEGRSIQPIDTGRIELWGEVNGLAKTGQLVEGARIGAGAAPHRQLYVQGDGQLGSAPTDRVSFLPYVHNVDSFGYDRAAVREGSPFGTESWGWLIDPDFRGRVGIVNEPTIGLFDMALACQAEGLVTFEDIGEMTRDEIDALFEVLLKLQRDGQFAAFWHSVPHSVELMSSGRVVVSSMFSPGVSALNEAGHDVVYAAPREGYRAWHGVMCLSSAASEEAQEAAYEYMNWWLSGWPGAFVARQGYYISTPERSRPHLSDAEWDYWYAGREARAELIGTNGKVAVRPGELRRGGSYENRFGHVAVWNTVMDSYEYSLRRWHSLLSA